SPQVGGYLARRTLPIALTLPFLLGWLRLLGQKAGYYGTEFGLALFACANTILFGLLLWGTARSLNAMDEQREQGLIFDARRREILEAIAKETPLPQIMEQIVLLVESQTPGTKCSVLLFEKDSGRLLDGAAPSLPQAYREAIDGIKIGPE